jgi:TonB family protein
MHLPHSAARAASHQPEHFDDSYFLEHLPRLPPDLVLDHPVRTLAVVVIANGQLRSAYVRASGSPELDIAILNSLRRIPVATEQGNVMWREYEISYQFTPDKEHAELYDEVREIVYMPPRPVHREPPDYPPLARKRGLQGNAVIKMVVTETGSVRDAKVEDATHPDFAEAALAAVKSWRFQPATRNGDPVAVWVRQPIPFMIR